MQVVLFIHTRCRSCAASAYVPEPLFFSKRCVGHINKSPRRHDGCLFVIFPAGNSHFWRVTRQQQLYFFEIKCRTLC